MFNLSGGGCNASVMVNQMAAEPCEPWGVRCRPAAALGCRGRPNLWHSRRPCCWLVPRVAAAPGCMRAPASQPNPWRPLQPLPPFAAARWTSGAPSAATRAWSFTPCSCGPPTRARPSFTNAQTASTSTPPTHEGLAAVFNFSTARAQGRRRRLWCSSHSPNLDRGGIARPAPCRRPPRASGSRPAGSGRRRC